MNIQTYLHDSRTNITSTLFTFLDTWQRRESFGSLTKTNLFDEYYKTLKGGKLIRGTLVHLGYSLHSQKPNLDLLKIASAVELVHASLLIHDDIIDKSMTRRGKPSLHIALGNNHYGVSQAICFGDLGFFLATELLNQTTFPPKLKNEAIQTFSQILTHTIIGEMLDIEIASKDDVSEAEVIDVYRKKTAEYTFVGPLVLGAKLARAPKKTLEHITDFGVNLGIAFQIQDDILGAFGEETVIGKSITSDIYEGKKTILYSYALSHATHAQKKFFQKYYGKGEISHEHYLLLKEVFVDTGALTYAIQKKEEYVTIAKNHIQYLSNNNMKKESLYHLIDLFLPKN